MILKGYNNVGGEQFVFVQQYFVGVLYVVVFQMVNLTIMISQYSSHIHKEVRYNMVHRKSSCTLIRLLVTKEQGCTKNRQTYIKKDHQL